MAEARNKRVTYNTPGHAHQLTFSCHLGLRSFEFDPVRKLFLAGLARARERLQFDVWAYVLMPEHVHILVNPRFREYKTEDIRSAIKNQSSAKLLNWLEANEPALYRKLVLYDSSGRKIRRFWQDGAGHDRNVWSPPAIWNSIEYIHANPVRRGLVQSPTDWPWSSARWFEGIRPVEFEVNPCPVEPPDPDSVVWRVWFEPE